MVISLAYSYFRQGKRPRNRTERSSIWKQFHCDERSCWGIGKSTNPFRSYLLDESQRFLPRPIHWLRQALSQWLPAIRLSIHPILWLLPCLQVKSITVRAQGETVALIELLAPSALMPACLASPFALRHRMPPLVARSVGLVWQHWILWEFHLLRRILVWRP